MHLYGFLNLALHQLKSQACGHVGQMDDFRNHIGYLMIDDAWYGGKEPPPNELGFRSIPR